MTQRELKHLRKVLDYGERLADMVKRANKFLRTWALESKKRTYPPGTFYKVTVTRVLMGEYGPRSRGQSMAFTAEPEEVRLHLLPLAREARERAKRTLKELEG